MKKQTKPNQALAAIMDGLQNLKVHTVGTPPKEPLDQSHIQARTDQPFDQLVSNIGPQAYNATDSAALDGAYAIVNSGFKKYIGQIVQAPIEAFRVEDNVRTIVEEDEEFEGMVNTIRSTGLLQNLLSEVAFSADGQEYLLLISGQRRLRAAHKAGKRFVPTLILPELDNKTRRRIGLIENLQRKELTPIDTAFAYSKLVADGSTIQELADELGCDRKTIQRYISLTTWPEPAIKLLKEHHYAFSTDFLFNKVSSDIRTHPEMLVLHLKRQIDRVNTNTGSAKQVSEPQPVVDDQVTRWNRAANKILGVPVKMSGSEDKLRITIRCSSPSDVKRVLEKLGIPSD